MSEEENVKPISMEYVLARLKEGDRIASGTWLERVVPGVCKHTVTRCVHGDEIIQRGYCRQACMVCGRSLDRDLPEICFFTGKRHVD